MRKRFPAPRALGGRSYADRYSKSRKLSTKEKSNGNSNPDQKKLLPGTTPIKFGPSVETYSPTGWLLILALFFTTLSLIYLLIWMAR